MFVCFFIISKTGWLHNKAVRWRKPPTREEMNSLVGFDLLFLPLWLY